MLTSLGCHHSKMTVPLFNSRAHNTTYKDQSEIEQFIVVNCDCEYGNNDWFKIDFFRNLWSWGVSNFYYLWKRKYYSRRILWRFKNTVEILYKHIFGGVRIKNFWEGCLFSRKRSKGCWPPRELNHHSIVFHSIWASTPNRLCFGGQRVVDHETFLYASWGSMRSLRNIHYFLIFYAPFRTLPTLKNAPVRVSTCKVRYLW